MGSINAALLVAVVLQCLTLAAAGQGSWQIIQKNAGIATMHAAVTHFDTAILLDRTNTGPTQIKLPNGRCRYQPLERISKVDCYAHSVMMNPANGAVRALFIFTDTWCSSGQFFDNGRLVQTGGDFEGNRKIRTLTPCAVNGNCDWVELAELLNLGRWYSSNQLLQSGVRQIIMGGRGTATYEFYPKRYAGEGSYNLAMLGGSNNLYPFVFLLPNGDLFVFANQDSVQFNWNTGRIVRKYPRLYPNPRNYPSAGSAVMLTLNWNQNFGVAEILVCGGASAGASASGNVNAPASASCGRIVATAAAPTWATLNMPIRRTMGDMVNLPTGDVLIINGAQNGYNGWGLARNPALNPVLFSLASGRFTTLAPTGIARMYHSTASLLSDGRILVAGSNTHQYYTFTGAFPTELRVEAFSPPYLQAGNRPGITNYPRALIYRQVFIITFNVGVRRGGVDVFQRSAPFTTHAFSQGQRILKLRTSLPVRVRGGYSVTVTAVSGNNIAPPAYYLLFVVQNGVPSRGVWTKQNN